MRIVCSYYVVWALFFGKVEALKNGLDLVPPLGWSNWESYGCNVSESIIKSNADAMIEKGLLDAGYTIVGIDDCWANFERNGSGYLVPNATKFPSGMKALGDYLHERGMKFGIYSSAGEFCCQHTMPGSLGYEWLDASLFAEWGVDFLKYDGCFMEGFHDVMMDSPRRFPFTPPPILRYPQMAMALNRTGRNISYLCNFPWQFWSLDSDPSMGGDWVGEFCNSWRTGGDAQPGFDNALGYVDGSEEYAPLVESGPGRWNHLDSIQIGNNRSFDEGVLASTRTAGDVGGMTEAQEQVVFSLFVVVKSPLFIGASVVDNLDHDSHSLRTLLNKEVIAVHQDPAGIRGSKSSKVRPCGELWSVANVDGGAAVLLVNRDHTQSCPNMTVDLVSDLDLDSTLTFHVRDMWAHADLPDTAAGQKTYEKRFDVDPTSGVMLRFTPESF